MDDIQTPMIPLFCTDITSDKSNEIFNGAEFISRTSQKQRMQEYESKQEDVEKSIEKTKFPLLLRIIKSVCGFLFLIIFLACIKAGFREALQNAPFLVIGGFLGGAIWLVLHLLSSKKEKRVLEEENVEQHLEELDQDLALLYTELGIPEDAQNVDVLVFRYKIKNGEIRPHVSFLQSTPYGNADLKIYATDEHVHIADLESVYSIPKAALKGITRVSKRISVPSWNKEEGPNEGSYKSYKMTENNGLVYFKPYYILNVAQDGRLYGVYFPCYELETFERITGLSAEE